MTVSTLYTELNEKLGEGKTVGLLTSYDINGSITRHLMLEGSPEFTEAEQQLTQNPGAIQTGSLLSSFGEDGSYTLLERFMAKPRLIILGGGHIAFALAEIAALTNFDVFVYDDRPSFVNTERFPSAKQVICDAFPNLGKHFTFGASDFIVDVTRGHQHDRECLEVILSGKEPAYTGMIGSARRVAIVMDQLREEGYSAERIERIHAPIGLRIGAQTTSEIAISIIAEIIAVKRTGAGKTQWLSGDLDLIEAVACKGFMPEAIITVLSTEGSVPTEVGCKLGMTYEGAIAGSVGGGCSESDAMQIGREVIKKGGWRIHEVDLTDSAEDEGMVCGGTMRVLIEKV